MTTSPGTTSAATESPGAHRDADDSPAPPADCACCGRAGREVLQLHCRRDVGVCDDCLDWLDSSRARRRRGRGGGWAAIGAQPVLLVRDLQRAVDHYERLGFTVMRHDATTAVASRDAAVQVRLAVTEWHDRAGHGTLHLVVDDADEVARAWRLAGATVVGPEENDGFWEGTHRDPDGNVLRFASALPVS